MSALGHDWPRPDTQEVRWQDDAACAGMDPALFFSSTPTGRAQAVAVCDGCPVRRECLEDALAQPANEDYGIRGGITERARRRLHTLRNPRPTSECGTISGYNRHQRTHTTICDVCREARSVYVRQLRVRS